MINNEKSLDYRSLEIKCGLELHQQLETNRKLFCKCKTELQNTEPIAQIVRYLRPTLSELGEYDPTALMEFKKKKTIIYEIHDSVCTYELDETPPIEADLKAIDIALTIARLLQMEVLNELHINRKQYLDGSIPSGFQRTMIVGLGGKIRISGKLVELDLLALEEDSCREITTKDRSIVWRLDRLGIPLVEITTKIIPVIDPNEIKEIAEGIGRVLRATGNVKRGLGTIRQDLNISIKNGARIEIKGVQKLDMLPEYIRLEVLRQLSLLEIKNELEKRKIASSDITLSYKDCREIFNKTKSKLFALAKKNKETIFGLRLPKMKGLLGKKIQANRTFGREIADRVTVITGLGGIIHSDELQKYDITSDEVNSIQSYLQCSLNDSFILIIGKEEDIVQAIEEVNIRVKEAFNGVPEETRHANEDGTTSFRRYLGGANRMYPDTDVKPIKISDLRLEHIESNLPELPEIKEERFIQELKIPIEIAKELVISKFNEIFDQIVKLGVDPMLAAVTLVQTTKALTREGLPIDNITNEKLYEVFVFVNNKKIAKDAIEPILRYLSKQPQEELQEVIIKLNLEKLTDEELSEIIDRIFSENSTIKKQNDEKAFNKIFGLIMKEVRGKIDGQIVNEKLKSKFHQKSKEL